MMRDIRIHIHPRKLCQLDEQFSATELALRQQIYWSLYTWEKTMSLCLGKTPAMHDTIRALSSGILDGEEAEYEIQKPKFATMPALEIGVSRKARINSRFIAYCQLCTVCSVPSK